METLKGIGVANGIAIGKALVILDEETVVFDDVIHESTVEKEIQRFNDALAKAITEIRAIRMQIEDKIGEEHAFIFDTHVLLLQDGRLTKETIRFIEEHRCEASFAFSQVLMSMLKEFSSLGDAYFVERGNDLKDVGKRVLKILKGKKEFGFKNLKSDVIVIGADFGPSNITHFDNEHILGFATDIGAQTTHTAIIAKALGLPAVVGLHHISKTARSGDVVILDSFSGRVFLHPNAETMDKYHKLMRIYEEEEASYRADLMEPARSKDGTEIELLANVELAHEADNAITNGAQGIGLYRTEFLFLNCVPELPSESIHYDTYCEIAEKLNGLPFTIRTLDMGGDKFFHRAFVREKEVNPVMGLRGVRLCLQRKDIFRTQLRAILRSAHRFKNIRMMFPLLSGVAEWRSILAFLEEVKLELRQEGVPFEEKPTLGAMIEVPSAALIVDYLAKELDFFSIGTNDLLQYFLAIDRGNDDVSYLYDPFHPGFVRLLQSMIQAAYDNNVEIACCGEMASSPTYASLLICLGLRKLSMNPASLPIIHHMVRAMDFQLLQEMVPKNAVSPTGAETLQSFKLAFKKLLSANDFQHLIDDFSKE